MSGRVLLDTNSIIYALNRGVTLPKAYYTTSIITEIELLAYPKITKSEEQNITKLLSHFEVFNIDKGIKVETIEIRKKYGIKLPDAIICATAIVHDAILISSDKQLSKIETLQVLELDPFCD